MRESVGSKNIEFRLDKPRPRVALSAMNNIKQYGRFFALCCLLVTLSCAGNKNGNGGGDPGSPPETPQNFEATASDGQVTLSWNTEPNVTYELYHSTETGFALESGMKISPVTTPYDHEELMNGTIYYYRLTANNSSGASEPTGEISATPGSPATPQNFTALASRKQVTLNWTAQEDVIYDLFYATAPGIDVESSTAAKFTNVTPPHTITGLMDDTTYYYRLTARNSFGTSTPTAEISATPRVVEKISAGDAHTCAVVNGSARCWGNGGKGRLGTGNSSNVSTPQQVNGLTSGVTQISANINHTCALANGAAKCWGFGEDGQRGDGLNTETETNPVQVSGLGSGVTQISAGGFHTCAVVEGRAMCWGNGGQGRLGSGSIAKRVTPFQVVGLTTRVTQISAGGFHSCAVVNGAAKCWGFGGNGRLGDGSGAQKLTPVQVMGLTRGVTQISVGDRHSCAVVNGAAKCWGEGGNGRLGDDMTTQRNTPVQVIGLTRGVTQISAGKEHTCAVVNGAAKCWGSGGNGRLGDDMTTQRNTPVQVIGLTSRVTQISAGKEHTCAVANGEAFCWGNGGSGRLGNNNSRDDQNTPVSVSDP